jgi:DNA phosphorothioation-dependent restriction protein DptH
MNMLTISRVLGKLIEGYFRSASSGGRDCRLLVPGLTRTIARQVHGYLLRERINSYLVVGEDEQTSETGRLIKAVGLTSKRIGSFVAIVDPGQLVHIQDSIRGSGGTIRSLAFSEEWPWIDNGSEPFRFDGPVLEVLVQGWSSDPAEQEWLCEFTLDGLLEHTRSCSRRAQILLEDIIGSFDPTSYSDIGDVRAKLLYHAGVPRPSGGVPAVSRMIRDSARLSQRIIERCQRDEGVREEARDMVLEVIPENERSAIRLSVDRFLDGVGRSSTLDLGVLAFYGCWGQDRDDPSDWSRLDSDRLAALFGVRDREQAEVSYAVRCERGLVSDDRKKLATFVGEQVEVDVTYRIPADQFSAATWVVRVLNRQRTLVEKVLTENEGEVDLQFDTATSTSRYSRRIPLRIALVAGGDIKADARLDMHLCGQDRPAFVVVEPGFEVVDATEASAEDTPDKKVDVDRPVHVYLFSHGEDEVALCNEDDEDLGLIETGMTGIWRSAQPVDANAKPSGQAVVVCSFGSLSVVICFEASDLEKGEFTIEDELRVLLVSGASEKRLEELISLFEGKRSEPYPALGRIDVAARRRVALAKVVTTRTGWRPLLTDLLQTDHDVSGSLGDFVNYLGPVEGEGLAALSLPADALPLLRTYSDAREAVLRQVESSLNARGTSADHPIYASHPIFVHERSPQLESLLVAYLKAYVKILSYIEASQKGLEWAQLLVLTHLDCVVHWDRTRLRNAFFLVGPWHPLVVAKRFMVQAALFSRALRQLHQPDGKAFRQLSALLRGVQGFRWVLGLSADDRLAEPAFVTTTSDPGWHVAFKTSCPTLAARENIAGLNGISRELRQNLGLAMEIGTGGSQDLTVTSLSNFSRAFPSRRSIGVRVRRGYAEGEVVRNVDAYLHAEDGPTSEGEQLPGGIRLYIEEPLAGDANAKWTNPPLFVFKFEDDAECVREAYPDIYVLPPVSDVSFRTGPEVRHLPRGSGFHAVFSEPLRWLTEGQTLVPKSISYEFDGPSEPATGIGGAFIEAMGRVREVLGAQVTTVSSVELPQRLSAPWVVIPGRSIDPAILVKYVRDGADRAIQERALWDYKLDVAGQANSFFILSTIPRGFQVAVNGFFDREDIAGGFIVELGRIGIAIGGEALKSGRHALGIIGLVGAVRLLVEKVGSVSAPLSCGPETIGFLAPVDSFGSFFGKSGMGDGKRADLLAVRLSLPNPDSGMLRISACGVESKFVSGALSITRAHAALEQALSTVREFKKLVATSLCSGAMPERLALLELLRFGLRITSPSKPDEIEHWVDTEGAVYQAVLAGTYEYRDAAHNAVLISTEGDLPGVAEHLVLEEGLWVRLTRAHWPGVADTPQLENIRRVLCRLFDTTSDSQPPPPSPPSTPTGPHDEQGGELLQISVLPPTGEPGPTTGPEVSQPEESQARQEVAEQEKGAALEGIFIGVDEARRIVLFDPQSPVDPLDNMNLMVTGSSGTGKTQFLKYIICKLREQGKNVLVLDLKNDFASDATLCERANLERVFVAFDGLPYNPLIPYPVRHPVTGEFFIQCGQYIAGVVSVLKRTYGLGAQQQVAVKNAIVAAFMSAGIPTTGSTPYTENLRFPDFSNVGNSLQHDNPLAYNRLDPLFTLGLFREEFRGQSFHALVNRAAVLDLSQIPSDEIKNALAQLVVLSAHAYYNTQPHSGTIRQFLVFDEGHRVLGSEYMLRLVRECRAYGVGTILSSQYPSDFPAEISASMATKVVHGNGRDSDRVKAIVQLLGCEGREGDAAGLDRFQAFVDNRHCPHTLLRTMNYPLYLVWSKLKEVKVAAREELSRVEGIDTSKLPIGNLVHQLERLGLVEEKEGQVFLLGRK